MKKYTNPYIDILLFDEEEDILTASTPTQSVGYTAAMDVNAQMEHITKGGGMSISTVRLEDIKIK